MPLGAGITRVHPDAQLVPCPHECLRREQRLQRRRREDALGALEPLPLFESRNVRREECVHRLANGVPADAMVGTERESPANRNDLGDLRMDRSAHSIAALEGAIQYDGRSPVRSPAAGAGRSNHTCESNLASRAGASPSALSIQ
jgi:hypothetical protein